MARWFYSSVTCLRVSSYVCLPGIHNPCPPQSGGQMATFFSPSPSPRSSTSRIGSCSGVSSSVSATQAFSGCQLSSLQCDGKVMQIHNLNHLLQQDPNFTPIPLRTFVVVISPPFGMWCYNRQFGLRVIGNMSRSVSDYQRDTGVGLPQPTSASVQPRDFTAI